MDGVESMGKKGKTQTHTTKNRVVDDDMMTVFRRIVDGDSQTEVEGKKKKKKKSPSLEISDPHLLFTIFCVCVCVAFIK